MVLKVGHVGKARFIRFIKKTNIFECGENGMVLERENKEVALYATNAACSKIYCTIPLGSDKILKTCKFVGIAYNDHVMLMDGGDIMVVIDYEAEKVSISKPGVTARGSKHWGEEVQEPWQEEYNAMFGLPTSVRRLGC